MVPGTQSGAVAEKSLMYLWGVWRTEEKQPDLFPGLLTPSQGIPTQWEASTSSKAAKTWERSRCRDSGHKAAPSQFHPQIRGGDTLTES